MNTSVRVNHRYLKTIAAGKTLSLLKIFKYFFCQDPDAKYKWLLLTRKTLVKSTECVQS